MSGEIKFRVLSGDKMEYFPLNGLNGWFTISGEIDISKCEIMQYTGLKDIHDSEIYEGDIVKSIEFNEVRKIFWCDGGFMFNEGFHFHQAAASKCEIVGNIYQNPE